MPRFVKVSKDGYHFELDGKPYVPVGFNYFLLSDGEKGWPPSKVWESPDPERWDREFARLAEMGVNVLRVFTYLSTLMPEQGVVSEEGLDLVERFLDIALKHGIRVILSGPYGDVKWASMLSFAYACAQYSEDRYLDALEIFYKRFSARFCDHEGLFGIDLHNEPTWVFDPAMKGAEHDVLWNYQKRRIAASSAFIRRMSAAIKSEDTNHLVSIGCHQCTSLFNSLGPESFYGFDPHDCLDSLDYVSFHFYPWCDHNHYLHEGDEETYQRNLALFLATARYMQLGKPVVLEEFALHSGDGYWPYVSEHTQARWITDLMEKGRDIITGWLYWGFRDDPHYTDSTAIQGLYRKDGTAKELGEIYPGLLAEIKKWTAAHTPEVPEATYAIDREKLLTDTDALLSTRDDVLRRIRAGERFTFEVR